MSIRTMFPGRIVILMILRKSYTKCFSHSLIGDPEVVIKRIASLSIPIHKIDLHKVLTFSTKKTQSKVGKGEANKTGNITF